MFEIVKNGSIQCFMLDVDKEFDNLMEHAISKHDEEVLILRHSDCGTSLLSMILKLKEQGHGKLNMIWITVNPFAQNDGIIIDVCGYNI